MNTCMIYATASVLAEAENLAKILVSERLVACVNILDGATSVYRWQDKVETSKESILIAKTSYARRDAAMARLQELHSYDTPCIVAYDIAAGLPDYLAWIASETEQD